MGDVISITDAQGNEIVQYDYDPWGKCNFLEPMIADEKFANDIANINPIRYRGNLVTGAATALTVVTSICSLLSGGDTSALAIAAGALAAAATIASGYVGLVSTRLSAHNKDCNLTLRLYTKGIEKDTFKVYERWLHA